jgi:hypothetical protein
LKKKIDSTTQIPPTLGIDLEDYAMENYCRTHHANHSEITCPKFINSFTTMLLPPKPPKKESKNEKEEDDDDQHEEEEDKEEEDPPSHLNLIWDEAEFGDDDDDDIMEEACVGHDYNIHSKGTLKFNDSPSIMRTSSKKTTTTTTSTSKQTSTDKPLEKEKEREKEITPSKSPISLDLTQKILGDLKLDYDVVEDLNKMKENIIVFELCKITKLREQLREDLQHIQNPQDVLVCNSKAELKAKS